MSIRLFISCVIVLISTGWKTGVALAAPVDLYWGQAINDEIVRSDRVGTNPIPLLAFPQTNGLVDISIDSLNGKIVWAQLFEDRIRRADLDGSNVETLLSFPFIQGLLAITTNPVDQTIYWAQSFNDQIMRSNADGSNLQILLEFPVVFGVVDIAIDPVAGKLYWAEGATGTIRRADLDGTNREDIIGFPDVSGVVAIAVDPQGGQLYWAQTFNDRIRRTNFSGTVVETVLETPITAGIVDIAVDPAGGEIFWLQADDTLWRASFSGADVLSIGDWPDVDQPLALTVAPGGVPCPNGAADCDDGNPCTDDTCQGGICQNSQIPNCVPCPNGAADCNDGIACTSEICVGGVCQFPDNCGDDGEPCNGDEFCDVGGTGQCEHTGDPCPGVCTPGQGCPCDAPLVESVGPRYIAITPQPIINPTPTAFLVTSSDWTCLSKYVGMFAKCGGTGATCNVDADCNSCSLLNSACLSDADCMTCGETTNPCQSDAECGGATCESVQVCQLSGLTCDLSSSFEEFDIDKDGLPDGILATLVDNDADRAVLTPEEWGTTTYLRCSHSQEPCSSDADCDIGACSVSGRGCSVSADDCRRLCAIAQTECRSDQECPGPGDACSGSQTCLTFETCQAGKIYVMSADIVPTDVDRASGTLFPISYTVQADCGSLSDPVSVVMRLWADADDNGLINIDDAFITILGFQNKFPPWVPSKTVVAFDIDGSACTPNQLVNINDVLFALLAFQGERFDPDTVGGNSACRLPCP